MDLEIHICMHNGKEFVRLDFDVFSVPFGWNRLKCIDCLLVN